MSCEYSDLKVSPDYLKFEAKKGDPMVPPKQYLQVEKTMHTLSPRWYIEIEITGGSLGPWLSVKPMNAEGSKKLRVGVDHRQLKAGTYNGKIRILPKKGYDIGIAPAMIPVDLVVKGDVTPEPPPQEFICPYCRFPFSNQAELEWHISSAHPEPEPEPKPEPPKPPPPKPEPNPLEKFFIWIWEWFRKRFNLE